MAPATKTDGLVDDEGNLFGVVNVVDALVLLLVLAVLVAGAGLVLGGGLGSNQESETTFVTLDMGAQPDYIVAALNEGDSYNPAEGSNLTITDLYLAPEGEQTRVLVRAELQGTVSDDNIEYANAPPRLGRSLNIKTNAYNVTGQISDIGRESGLDTAATTVVLRNTVSTADANAITPGDRVTVAGRTAATVEAVAVYPTTNANRRQILVEANLSTYTQQGVRRFGGTALRPGQQVTLPGPRYTLDGQIERVNGGLDSESLTNRTVTLELARAQPEFAAAIQPGQTERTGGQTTAYVTDVTTEPTPIISTAQNGSVVVSDHPTLRDVTLTTELRVRETEGGVEFRGERLQYGSTVLLDLGPVTANTTVGNIDQ